MTECLLQASVEAQLLSSELLGLPHDTSMVQPQAILISDAVYLCVGIIENKYSFPGPNGFEGNVLH
jgi:hypothetical protein